MKEWKPLSPSMARANGAQPLEQLARATSGPAMSSRTTCATLPRRKTDLAPRQGNSACVTMSSRARTTSASGAWARSVPASRSSVVSRPWCSRRARAAGRLRRRRCLRCAYPLTCRTPLVHAGTYPPRVRLHAPPRTRPATQPSGRGEPAVTQPRRHTVSSVSPRALVIADETPVARTRRARKMYRSLHERYPYAHCELDFTTPLELLVATILSAQTTDVGVNKVTPIVFAKYPTAADYANADRTELETIIQPTGFYRAKTDSLIKLGIALVERFDGEVPPRLKDLVTLPGRRPQDGERRARQRLRHPRHHRRHALRPPRAPLRLDRGGGPGQGRARGRAPVHAQGLDDAQPRRHLPRPPHVPREEAGLRGVPGRARGAPATAPARPTPTRRRSS